MADALPEQWANREFADNYLQIADTIIVGRKRSLEMLKSFYRHFLENNKPNTILDLGCGDGILTYELLQIDDSISAVLIDGSESMLEKASEKLSDLKQSQFIQANFQDLITSGIELRQFNLAVSSLAIHHLTNVEKLDFFRYVFSCLVEGGYFIVIDTVRAPASPVEEWQMKLWKEGAIEQGHSSEIEDIFTKMVQQYMAEGHYCNIDTLESQMNALKDAGFQDVDCFYKRGMFAMYGGKK
ncbi:MAG: class I SAM-dependent methyltransferase [Chloroflexi bacterium]|jgi:tRNA (cmo5U34)-methyltransferase|nr:class I SAM-dependent methyltransferase [Chloroflexota bacterium]